MTEFIYHNDHPRSIPFTDEQLRNIAYRYESMRDSTRAIGLDYGVDPTVIARRLKSLGIPMARKGRPMIDADLIEKARKLRESGKSWKYVEAVTGVCESSIRRRLKSAA